jgi:hypothetical protein
MYDVIRLRYNDVTLKKISKKMNESSGELSDVSDQLSDNQLNDKYVVWQSTPKRQICRFGSQPSNDKNVALALKGLMHQPVSFIKILHIYNFN